MRDASRIHARKFWVRLAPVTTIIEAIDFFKYLKTAWGEAWVVVDIPGVSYYQTKSLYPVFRDYVMFIVNGGLEMTLTIFTRKGDNHVQQDKEQA